MGRRGYHRQVRRAAFQLKECQLDTAVLKVRARRQPAVASLVDLTRGSVGGRPVAGSWCPNPL